MKYINNKIKETVYYITNNDLIISTNRKLKKNKLIKRSSINSLISLLKTRNSNKKDYKKNSILIDKLYQNFKAETENNLFKKIAVDAQKKYNQSNEYHSSDKILEKQFILIALKNKELKNLFQDVMVLLFMRPDPLKTKTLDSVNFFYNNQQQDFINNEVIFFIEKINNTDLKEDIILSLSDFIIKNKLEETLKLEPEQIYALKQAQFNKNNLLGENPRYFIKNFSSHSYFFHINNNKSDLYKKAFLQTIDILDFLIEEKKEEKHKEKDKFIITTTMEDYEALIRKYLDIEINTIENLRSNCYKGFENKHIDDEEYKETHLYYNLVKEHKKEKKKQATL